MYKTVKSENSIEEFNNKRLKIDHVAIDSKTEKEDEDEDEDDMFGDDIAIEELQDLGVIHATPMKYEEEVIKTVNVEASLVDTSDIFDDDIPLEELDNVLTQVEKTIPQKRRKFTRYLVACVTNERYDVDGEQYNEKVVLLLQEDEKRVTTARLRQEWMQTLIEVGNVVHIPIIDTLEEIIIDNKHNFIVVHPDRLISCTAVADSFVCLRKSIFQLKVRPVSEYTEALVHGNIIHRVLQNALRTGDFKVESIKQEIIKVVLEFLQDLYAMDQDEETAILILSEYADSISQFGASFVGQYPKAPVNTDMGLDPSKIMGFEHISISNVLDIEEHLWSPTFGLKGMVDASVQMKMSKNNKVLTVPFELKTGKTNRFLTNRAQTLLYTLLMSDRYDVDVGAGILYFSKSNSLYVIPSSHDDLRSLIISRNALAIAFNNQEIVPSMIKDSHTCQYCYVNDACTIYHKAVEKGTGLTSGLFQLFEEKTDHLSETTCTFFDHWWKLLDKEEIDVDYIRKDIWSQPAEMREQVGRCLSNLKLNLPLCDVDPSISKYLYSFIRYNSSTAITSTITVGDPVIVSSMEGHINLAMGYVHHISSSDIQLILTEPLRNPPHKERDFDSQTNQAFNSFVKHKTEVISYYNQTNVHYRIDKDEMSTGMGMLRNNLVRLAARDEQGCTKNARLRELIVDLEKPDFSSEQFNLPPTPNMNSDQRKALKKVLQAKDYALILGMPGTGKTTTTAEIIRYLVSQGKSVLVAAYTHTALDNVLSKVREKGVDILRLGNLQKVMPSLRDCVPSSNLDVKTVKAMQEIYDSKRVVGVTCLGIGEVLLQKREFDYCIIDEASQITLPTCIGPLRYAKTFVLVGDLYQLPPIVRNKDATEGGLDKSLFSILAAARPEAISYLEFQYRMNRDIMEITNHLVYGGKLKCGNQETASRKLEIPYMDAGLNILHSRPNQLCKGHSDCWLRHILDPSQRVVFVNIDALNAKESRPFGSFLQNNTEAILIEQAVEAFIQSGISEEQMALISVYRSQLRLISQGLKNRQGIEIATIDKYQGRDKDCVIISLVRNNDTGNAGDLLRDWRRLNVAITRAKSKLILFGSVSTLKATSLYFSLLDSFEKKGWILNLPFKSEEAHEIVSTTTTTKKSIKHKTILPTNAVLKKNEVLRDIYNEIQF